MPMTATIDTKTKIDQFSMDNNIEISVDTYVSVKEVICPSKKVELEMYAGPADGIELVAIKADIPKKTDCAPRAMNCSTTQDKYVKVAFTDDSCSGPGPSMWIDVKGTGTLLLGKALNGVLPKKIERVHINNELTTTATVTVLIARSRATPCKKAAVVDGDQ